MPTVTEALNKVRANLHEVQRLVSVQPIEDRVSAPIGTPAVGNSLTEAMTFFNSAKTRLRELQDRKVA